MIYDNPVADLIPGGFLEVRCACGHETRIPLSVLLQEMGLRTDDRIMALACWSHWYVR